MKKLTKFFTLLLLFTAEIWIVPQKSKAQVSVSFQVFYDELSPYGMWVDNPEYGYVWMPGVAQGFMPYATNGHWVYTEEGWTWFSDYSWGWAPFHYGRWYIDPVYGPMWVPGNDWGPGWVTWRRSGGYYGWAPIGPGVSINIAYGHGYKVPNNHWRFVRDHDFGRTDISQHYVNTTENVTIIKNSAVINNTYINKTRKITYNSGPDRTEVEKNAGKKITPVSIKEYNRPGQISGKGQIQIYRPHLQQNNANSPKAVPSKVTNLKDIKSPKQTPSKAPEQKPKQTPQKQQPPHEKRQIKNENNVPQKSATPGEKRPKQQHSEPNKKDEKK